MNFSRISYNFYINFILLLVIFPINAALQPKGIKVAIQANFQSPPLLLETSEFLADFSTYTFWDFISLLSTPSIETGVTTGSLLSNDEKSWKWILENFLKDFSLGGLGLSNSAFVALNFSIFGTRTYSLKVETYRQLLLDNLHNSLINTKECPVIAVFSTSNIQCLKSKNDIKNLLSKPFPNSEMNVDIFQFDHIYTYSATKTTDSDSPFILYADYTSTIFHSFFTSFISYKKTKPFVLRPILNTNFKASQIIFPGCGVELAVKNMEYKVLDDRKIEMESHISDLSLENIDTDTDINGFFFSTLSSRYPQQKNELFAFKDHLLERHEQEPAIWEMSDLGFQASQRILTSKNPLYLMQEISQYFPLYMASIAKTHIDPRIQSNLNQIHTILDSSSLKTQIIINGIILDSKSTTLFDIQKIFMNIARTSNILTDFLSQNSQRDLISNYIINSAPIHNARSLQKLQYMGDNRKMDNSIRLDVRSNSVIWLNDLEKDKRYSKWGSHIQRLVSMYWQSGLHKIARNLYQVVVVIDPTQISSINILNDIVKMIQDKYPVRFGIAFDLSLSNHSHLSSKELYSLSLYSWFDHLKFSNFLTQDFEQNEIDKFVSNSLSFTRDKGLFHGDMVLNGEIDSFLDLKESFQDRISHFTTDEQQKMTIRTYIGEVNEKTNFTDYPYTQSDVVHRYSQLFSYEQNAIICDSLPSKSNNIFYFNPNHNPISPITLHIISDFSSLVGTSILQASLDYILNNDTFNHKSRISFIHNPSFIQKNIQKNICEESFLQPISNTIRYISDSSFWEWENGDFLEYQNIILEYTSHLNRIAGFFAEVFCSSNSLDSNESNKKWMISKSAELLIHQFTNKYSLPNELTNKLLSSIDNNLFVKGNSSALGLFLPEITPGTTALLINGKLYTITGKHSFNFIDIEAVVSSTYDKMNIDYKNINNNEISNLKNSDDFLKISFALSTLKSQITDNIIKDFEWERFQILKQTESKNIIRYTQPNSIFDMYVVIDPISFDAQKWSQIIRELVDSFDVNLLLILRPESENTKNMPLARYFTMAFSPLVEFDDGILSQTRNIVTFHNMRTNKVLTLGLDTPESWFTESAYTQYDLDNIRLNEVESPVLNAIFNLSSILIAGHSIDRSLTKMSHPAGMQLELTRSNNDIRVHDTIVMENLGYFQLQATAGVWKIKMTGKSSEIYRPIMTSEGNIINDTILLPVINHNPGSLYINVLKKEGMENEQLNDKKNEKKKKGGIFNWYSSSTKPKSEKEKEKINVFSLASGHLYERFLKIMMLSVINATKTPVKFWFIKNFLSPQFKAFVPIMAKEYGFEVELITYKWPNWLRRQTVKQRIIWGYKILFLDVIFPLNLSRVIYVDADQVVRGDLKELVDLDMGEAPYGYTPFCNSNILTEGFRFWKQGYWLQHLRGAPYHISALYVVDLDRFRATKAGDTLRIIYDKLSADENSLSNLDQDLPNYAQHQVPIYSLKQEWLWCETWCSMDTLSTAKTIDLCNNPLTKEPKIDVARRVVSEWTSLDMLAHDLELKYYEYTHGEIDSTSIFVNVTDHHTNTKRTRVKEPHTEL